MSAPIQLRTTATGVATVTLNTPDKHNVLSAQMIHDLTETARKLADDPAVRVVVLTGAGKSFCAGGDLNWMKQQMAGDDSARADAARAIATLLSTLNTLPKPLIGRIQGAAMGGGVGLCCVCDVAIADTDARFGLTETRLGLIPATIGPYVIARMGEARARRVFMSSRVFEASEAVQLGVIARAVPGADLDRAIAAEVTPYLSCAPGAVAAAKALARRLGPVIDQAAIEASIAALIQRWQSPEAGEGIDAFFARRPASWARND